MGRSSISMGHIFHGYVSHNQMVTLCELEHVEIMAGYGDEKKLFTSSEDALEFIQTCL